MNICINKNCKNNSKVNNFVKYCQYCKCTKKYCDLPKVSNKWCKKHSICCVYGCDQPRLNYNPECLNHV